ncbi:unnamed protein product, partial [Meganyctiphanes norvegica]
SGSCKDTQSLKDKCIKKREFSSCLGRVRSLRTPDFTCDVPLNRRKREAMAKPAAHPRQAKRLNKNGRKIGRNNNKKTTIQSDLEDIPMKESLAKQSDDSCDGDCGGIGELFTFIQSLIPEGITESCCPEWCCDRYDYDSYYPEDYDEYDTAREGNCHNCKLTWLCCNQREMFNWGVGLITTV